MKIILKIIGSFFCVLIALLTLVSISSHAAVHRMNQSQADDIKKLLADDAQRKIDIEKLRNKIPEKTP
jgi:hypothetical protein